LIVPRQWVSSACRPGQSAARGFPSRQLQNQDKAMQPFETIYVDSTVVACNGGGGPLGHPRVYLNLSADGQVECPYCSRLFVREGRRGAVGHGVENPSAIAPGQARPGEHEPPAAPAKP
jgi:uncharacterized Zn-finger protein